MRKLALSLLLALVWLTPAAAQDDWADMKSIIARSLRWIERSTDYKDLEPPRHWVELSAEQIGARGGNTVYDGGRVFALYSCSEKTLYIRKDADLSRVGVQSYILHEMVHHAQCVNHRLQSDGCGREREAYALQAKWLRDQAARYSAPADKKWLAESASSAEKYADTACANLRR